MKKTNRYAWLLALSMPVAAIAQEKVDLEMMKKIREEGLQRSQVMDIAFNLTDKSGNRLTNSAGYARAANYAKEALTSWGVSNATLDPWGEFGKGWDLEKAYVAITAPYYKPILAWPKTWTAGTKGLKNAEIMVVEAKDTLAIQAYSGKLKNKILIIDQLNEYKHSFKADAVRYTDEQLAKMAAVTPAPPSPATRCRASRRSSSSRTHPGSSGSSSTPSSSASSSLATSAWTCAAHTPIRSVKRPTSAISPIAIRAPSETISIASARRGRARRWRSANWTKMYGPAASTSATACPPRTRSS